MSRTVVGDERGIQITLDIPPAFERAVRRGDLLTDIQREFLQRAGNEIWSGAQDRAPADTGRLRGSLHVDTQQQGDVVIVGSNVKYAAPQEFGTRPFWPPYKNAGFQRWARRHGMNAFLVARAIARRGIRPKRYLTGSFEHYKKTKIVTDTRWFQMAALKRWASLNR